MKYRSMSGFTIVELLIVIVVIGILAAITIVAYNGIQIRAQNASVQSDVKSNSTKINVFRATYDRLPSTSEIFSDSSITQKFSGTNTVKLASYCVANTQYAIGGQ